MHPGLEAAQFGEFLVMGGKQGLDPDPLQVVEVFGHGPGQGQTVEGGGAPADLVQDHQAPGRGLVQDAGGFVHLHQKGALAPADVVHRPHPGEDAVGEPDDGRVGRHEAAQVGQERDQRHLAQDGGFARTCWGR